MPPRAPLRPVLKWAGGKTSSLPEILAALPGKIDTYYEPFVGGGAVFFALASEGRFERAVLGDGNSELVDLYRALKKDVGAVIALLRRYRYDSDQYYEVRAQRPEDLDLPERAARTIYLNKTGFNGLYRVNAQGLFNVPFGRHANPTICDEPLLRTVASALRSARAKLEVADFARTVRDAKPGDAVYLDPPYAPVSATANFTAYRGGGFGEEEQERLAKLLGELSRRKVHAVLSNSDTELTRRLYTGWDIREVEVARRINSRGTGRGAVTELLVVNRRPRKTARARARTR
ncbi:MAG: DNA adenine methylase [Deltaproteobacteria bacterium]|nr:DNA adenine methylase [Deltaproteobacteria bacterium]